MKAIILRFWDESLLDELRALADAEGRPTNQQVILAIKEQLARKEAKKEATRAV